MNAQEYATYVRKTLDIGVGLLEGKLPPEANCPGDETIRSYVKRNLSQGLTVKDCLLSKMNDSMTWHLRKCDRCRGVAFFEQFGTHPV